MKWLKNKRLRKFVRLAKNYQVSIVLALIGLVLIGVGFSVTKFSKQSSEPQFTSAQEGENSGQFVVDIAGAVNKPGIYNLASGSRVSDAIEKAGGFSGQSDNAWISQNLNLASKITDGQKIYIPLVGEAGKSSTGSVAGQTAGKINVNFASSSELDTLPGIGPVTAQKIISGRPYSSVDELLSRKVVGAATFEKIKDKISAY
jgi:competence protein ComEA